MAHPFDGEMGRYKLNAISPAKYIGAAMLHGFHTPDNLLKMKSTLNASLLDEKMRFRVHIKHAVAIGPGKAEVLQGIAETGSMAETGRRLNMSYQRVWALVRAMNVDFVEPLVVKKRGGKAGGGAQLTETGKCVLSIYRGIERDAQRAVAKRLPELVKLIRPGAGSTTNA